MSERRAATGRIKLYEPGNRRGVIEIRDVDLRQNLQLPEDLFFQLEQDQSPQLRVGQLVRFMVEGDGKEAEARDIAVLSEQA